MKSGSSCTDNSSLESIIVGTVLTTGIVISYIPQIVGIIRRGSSEGLSYVTMWLSFVAGYLTLINAILLQWDKITCAQHLTVGQTLATLLPLIQLLVGPLCQYILYLATVVYFPVRPTSTATKEDQKRHYYVAVLLLVIVIFGAIALAGSVVAMVANVDSDDDALTGYASSLGITSALITIGVWMPQIYTTWKLRDPGALSLWMLLLQMPGAVLVVYFQGVVNDGNWTTWVPYVAQALQQSILIALWLLFRCCYGRLVNRSKSHYSLQDVSGGNHLDNEGEIEKGSFSPEERSSLLRAEESIN